MQPEIGIINYPGKPLVFLHIWLFLVSMPLVLKYDEVGLCSVLLYRWQNIVTRLGNPFGAFIVALSWICIKSIEEL